MLKKKNESSTYNAAMLQQQQYVAANALLPPPPPPPPLPHHHNLHLVYQQQNRLQQQQHQHQHQHQHYSTVVQQQQQIPALVSPTQFNIRAPPPIPGQFVQAAAHQPVATLTSPQSSDDLNKTIEKLVEQINAFNLEKLKRIR